MVLTQHSEEKKQIMTFARLQTLVLHGTSEMSWSDPAAGTGTGRHLDSVQTKSACLALTKVQLKRESTHTFPPPPPASLQLCVLQEHNLSTVCPGNLHMT